MPQLTEEYVRAQIARTRTNTALLFAGSLAVLFGGVWVASESTGPAADIVYVIACVVGGLSSLIFGIFFLAHFQEAKRALRDLPHFRDDPEAFERIHRGALRIPWK